MQPSNSRPDELIQTFSANRDRISKPQYGFGIGRYSRRRLKNPRIVELEGSRDRSKERSRTPSPCLLRTVGNWELRFTFGCRLATIPTL